ncbi:heme exporter protein CcmB, partial [Nitrospinae bacterium]|nr:heme exporter protein CcmB [Nitrospinota bacterium]
MNLYLSQISAIVWKDFVTELKTRELFSAMFIFALLVILIFIFSVNLSIVNASEVGPGILWVAFLFSGTLGLNRSFVLEKENECLMGLMLAPADRTAIYFGKLISNLVFLSIMELFILPLFMIFFNIDILEHLLPLLLVIFLGTLGFCSLGTLLSSLASNLKTREIMLPILLYPLLIPIVIGVVRMTGQVLAGEPLSEMMNWIGL